MTMASKKALSRIWLAFLVLLGCALAACGGADSADVTDVAACADDKAILVPETGDYSRSIDTESEQAQAFFDQGLRLAYSYYFPEALASFEAGLCFDSDNPMLQWGRALAIAPNPNSGYGGAKEDPEDKGKAAIASAQAEADSLPAVDQALIETLAVLFDTQGYPEQQARSQAFIDATQDLIQQFPNDPEAAFLAADAIMMASPWNYFSADGSPIGRAGDALAILEKGIEQNPRHPGLNHLHIHLLENSQEPERAESSADRLESLAPRAGHMVHMPGHIYMRVGRYDDAVATNERSLAADDYFSKHWGDRPLPLGTTSGLSHRGHGGHARSFIQWASLLQGNGSRAVEMAELAAEAISVDNLGPSWTLRTVATYWLTLRAFGEWEDILALSAPPASQPYLTGIFHSVRGSAHLAQGNVDSAEAALSALQRAADSDGLEEQRASINTAADLLAMAESVLEGEIAAARGDRERSIQHFQTAVAIQNQLRYIEPPDWIHSARLYLGQAYLEAGEPDAAEGVFRADLESLRENGWALYGLAESLTAQGKSGEAESVRARFTKAWANADVELTAAHF